MAKLVPPVAFDLAIEPGSIKGSATDTGASRSEAWLIPIDRLTVIENFNLRVTGTKEYEAKLEELAQSIFENGFYRDKPLSVKPIKLEDGSGGYAITDGHRRFAAAQRAIAMGAEITALPAVTVSNTASQEDLTIAMMQNGEPLSTYETALGVARLIKWGMDEAQVAKKLGVTKTYIGDLITLVSMPAKIRNMVMSGEVSATLAVKEYRADAKTAADRLSTGLETAKKAGKTKVTSRNVEKADPKVKAGTAKTGAEPEEGKPARGRKPNPLRFEFEFAQNAGDEIPISTLAPFSKLGGGAWFELSETEGYAVIVQDVKIKGVCVLKEKPIGEVVGAVAPTVAGTEDL